MRIKNRLYPYPVLRPTTGDYQKSTFHATVTPQISDAECKLLLSMTCENQSIIKMIKDGRALYAVHIECKYTYFRLLKYSPQPRFSIVIDGNTVDRALEICPIIVAMQDIVDYSDSDLDDVYSGESIVIPNGSPLAIGEQSTITITKEKDALKKLSSPFCVLPYPDTDEMPPQKYATVNYADQEQIIIYLPEDDYMILARLQEAKSTNMNTIHAAIYFPALLEAIDYMKSELSDAEQEKRWYIALNAKANEKALGNIKGNTRSAFELAQILFDYPLSRWLRDYTKI